jgi:hypothetical protein
MPVSQMTLHRERCPPRQKSRVEPLKEKVEPLLTSVTVDYFHRYAKATAWMSLLRKVHGSQKGPDDPDSPDIPGVRDFSYLTECINR